MIRAEGQSDLDVIREVNRLALDGVEGEVRYPPPFDGL
jgi:hypothetical protein